MDFRGSVVFITGPEIEFSAINAKMYRLLLHEGLIMKSAFKTKQQQTTIR